MKNEKDFPAYPSEFETYIKAEGEEKQKIKFTHQGLTARDVFAKDAPDAPEWFEKEKIDSNMYLFSVNEKIFFEWRWYYADMMLKTR